ncbi:cupredoxin domain-containing protein [Geminicoccus flavidas]|uniref:cupredoxin domain-containing protein n=1 Tax=Geminicoccus flavidas TaxID=2506407 RepID=UPI00135A870B|nr:copper resistance protein [Geminicoccus flavidas]
MRIFNAILPAVVMVPLAGGIAFADAGHGHYKFGEPGQESEVTRAVEVIADDADGMELIMDVGTIQQGETIKFVITNKGAGDHEFSVGDTASQRAHAKLMAKNPDMKHDDDPSAVTLAPGETKTVIWKFNKPVQGNIVFACQMPGHYEAGMVHQAKLAKSKKTG